MTTPRALLIMVTILVVARAEGGAQRTSVARIRPVPAAEWTAADREILGTMGARGDQTIDVFKTCLRHTELCRAWMPFTRYVLSQASPDTIEDMFAATEVTATFATIVKRPKVVKRTICFGKRTIKVPKSQVAKYKKRGAKLGPCKQAKKRRPR